MHDPVSPAQTFILFSIPSALTLAPLLTTSLPSPPDDPSSPAPSAYGFYICPFYMSLPYLGWQTEPRYLSVRHCSPSDSSGRCRSDLRLGTSSLTCSHLLPSLATCWKIRSLRSLGFVHMLPSGGRVGAALGDEGREGRVAHSPHTFPHPLWTGPSIPVLSSLDLIPSRST